MTNQIPLREQLLRYFDHYDRWHPGTFTSAGAAVGGSDSTAAYQAIREMAYGGVLALTTMPVTVVDNGTLVRITNKGRALCGESAKDQAMGKRGIMIKIGARLRDVAQRWRDGPALRQRLHPLRRVAHNPQSFRRSQRWRPERWRPSQLSIRWRRAPAR